MLTLVSYFFYLIKIKFDMRCENIQFVFICNIFCNIHMIQFTILLLYTFDISYPHLLVIGIQKYHSPPPPHTPPPPHIDGNAGDLVNPPKSRHEVYDEGEQARNLYRLSHADYLVGEQKMRDYAPPTFDRHSVFGLPTTHDNEGWVRLSDLLAPPGPRIQNRITFTVSE